jgi:putative peptide zinc metalloprotease protein
MGAGIYLVWPAFYTDVTDSYRLDRTGRLRVDLGGIYFNCLFVLLIAGAYAVTGFEPLLILIIVQHMQIVQQLLPFLRLDGYYILSDLTGVPDLFARIKPTLKSAVPGQETEQAVDELKPWVRRVTLAWVVFLIPVLLLMFGMMLFNAPRAAATAWDSLGVQWGRIGNGGAGDVSMGVVQSAALVLPLAGMALATGRIGGRIAGGAWRWSDEAPLRRSLVVGTAVAIVAVGAYVLYPNGEYRPIQAGERGTIQGGVAQLRSVPSGRPALTPERENELGGAPTVRSGKAPLPSSTSDAPAEPASTSPTTTESETTEETSTEPAATTAPAEATEPAETTAPAATETEPADTTTTTTGTTSTETTETTTTETETTTP